MSKTDALFILPIVGDILGIRNISQLVESDRNRLEELAQNALNKWNEKINKYNYSGANLVTGKPDYQWLKRQLYENQTQEVYNFQKELAAAKAKDANDSRNLGLVNAGKNIANYFVDQFKTVGNVVGSATSKWDNGKLNNKVNDTLNGWTSDIKRWGNENTYNVLDKYKNKFSGKDNLQSRVNQINKQQIASHNSNRNALNEYRKGPR